MKRAISLLIIVGLVLFGVSGVAYVASEREDPENLFKAMLNNNLRTTSVTRSVEQLDGQQALEQFVRLQPSGQNIVFAKTVLEQRGEPQLNQPSARVVTENIGTPSSDYVQYIDIESFQEDENGEMVEMNFEEILGIWGESLPDDPTQTSGELYNELALAAIPFGNLSKQDRAELLTYIESESVYVVNYEAANKTTVNSRQVIVYPVSVQPQAYIGLLKLYASKVGLTQLQDVDTSIYADSQPLELTIAIDIASQRLANVSYPNGRTEQYGSYGVAVREDIPTESIPLSELQSRIQSLQ